MQAALQANANGPVAHFYRPRGRTDLSNVGIEALDRITTWQLLAVFYQTSFLLVQQIFISKSSSNQSQSKSI
jgi:hypothetical protein